MNITDVTSESYSCPRVRPMLMLDADGMLAPPDRPGFGYEIDEEALHQYRTG